MSLSVCPTCDRHRRHEGACPFCGELVLAVEAPRPIVPLGSLASRAALVFGGMALGASMGVGCVSKGDVYGGPPPPVDAGPKSMSPMMPAYGGPPPIELVPEAAAEPPKAPSTDASARTKVSAVPLYGSPGTLKSK